MQVIEIEDNLMAEICEAANFAEKSCSDYVNSVLVEALQKYRKQKQIAQQYAEAYTKFPQELDDSDEEFEHWRKVFEEFERSEK